MQFGPRKSGGKGEIPRKKGCIFEIRVLNYMSQDRGIAPFSKLRNTILYALGENQQNPIPDAPEQKGTLMVKKKLLRVLLALLLVAVMTGCSSGGSAQEAQTDAAVPATEALTAEAPATEVVEETQAPTVPQPTVPQNCVVVSTAYGNFLYQDQWIEFMRVEQHAEGSNLRVSFSADINNVRYALFELLIGEMDGTPIGKITDADGAQRNVYVYMMEIEPSPALTDSELNRLYAMQEDINYIIENMK